MPPQPHSSIPLRPSQEFDRNVQQQQQPYRSRPQSSYSQNPPPSASQERYRDYPPSTRSRGDEYRDEDYGREYDEDGGYDIYADFNNTGPRYSKAPLVTGVTSQHIAPSIRGDRSTKSYRPLSSVGGSSVYGAGQPILGPNMKGMQSNSSLYGGKPMSAAQLEVSELVSVPVLGAEWKRSELHDLSAAGRSEQNAHKRRQVWKRFARDEDRRCFGFSIRQAIVWGLLAFCILLGITLYFVIPRVPSLAFSSSQPFTMPDGATNTSEYISFSRAPANFSFPANLALQADTSSGYIPINMQSLFVTMYDSNTTEAVGNGTWTGTLPSKSLTSISVPVIFSYAAVNTSDQTWLEFHNACEHLWTGIVRPNLKIKINVEMKIAGLVTTHSTSTQISEISCPYELPTNSA